MDPVRSEKARTSSRRRTQAILRRAALQPAAFDIRDERRIMAYAVEVED